MGLLNQVWQIGFISPLLFGFWAAGFRENIFVFVVGAKLHGLSLESARHFLSLQKKYKSITLIDIKATPGQFYIHSV